MSFYPFDGDIKFGWRSFGRSFAIAGILALAVAASGFLVMRSVPAHAVDPETQLLATAAEWIGGALFIILAIATHSSIRISREERGDVEITPEGVRRIFAPGRADFLPFDQIAGLMGRPSGGVQLINRTNGRDMIIPRSIDGYRDCVAELKTMGVKPLPGDLKRIQACGKRSFSEKLLYFTFNAALCVSAVIYFSKDVPSLIRHTAGLVGLAVFLVPVRLELRTSRRFSLISWLLVLLVLAVLVWRW